jgi:ACS family hexuronate transporter-like MFS transporter
LGRQNILIADEFLIVHETKGSSWKWWVCGLLLLASMINYMDRQTLANAAVRITTQFSLKQEQYGNLELAFGWAFAVGSIGFGVMADRVSVRWLYPGVVLLWSLTAFLTGLVENYEGLLVCRTALGFFEAGHWPCAIKTTQRLLGPQDRALGNGLLQSGASVGAIITPLVMQAMLTPAIGSWRFAFQVIAAIGVLWIPMWLWTVRGHDLPVVTDAAGQPSSTWRDLVTRRMAVILVVIACINTCWQTLRAWLPKFLIEGRGYAEVDALYFNSLYFVASDIGCIGAGALVLWLVRRRLNLHTARMAVFFVCSLLTALTLFIPALPKGWLLLSVLLLVAAGALGVFPVYHALTQEISRHHQGKVTGVAGIAAWAFSPPLQTLFGRVIDKTHSFDWGFALVGCTPLIAFLALWLFWDRRT